MNDRTNLARRAVAALAALAVAALPACANIEPGEYAAQRPLLELERFFDGTLDGYGMVQDRSGKVLRRFKVVIRANWEAGVGTLDEEFVWSDGERQRRVWTLRALGEGRYSGTADDVVGEAEGRAAGNALHWRYVLAVPVDGKVWNLDLDDWMFLIDDRVLLNRAVMRKFGFRVGEITLSLVKR